MVITTTTTTTSTHADDDPVFNFFFFFFHCFFVDNVAVFLDAVTAARLGVLRRLSPAISVDSSTAVSMYISCALCSATRECYGVPEDRGEVLH